jgi:putative colanic acid biosynthesis glycosyltransferase WcaI
MTHILIISRYYPPEIAVSGVCISEMAKRLTGLGHQVTVLTTVPNYPNGIVPLKYRGHILQNETLDGVHVIRAWSYAAPNKGFLRRVLAQLSFGCITPFLGWKEVGCPDIILVSSPPLFTVIAGRLLVWLKRCPLVLRVADIWPESAIQLGVLRNRILIRLAEWLEWSTYERASLVWVVTEGIRNTLIRRGLSPEHILLLTNGVDSTTFSPLPKPQARAELGWDDRFTVLYAGGHGISHGLTTLLDAAELIHNRDDMRIVLVGDGAVKAELRARAQKLGLTNVSFLDAQPHHRMPLFFAAADACLVHMRKLPLFQGTLPIKMYEGMACARPIVLAMDGEARKLAEQDAGAAIYVEPENPTALVSALLYLRDHPEQAEELGRRGRVLVETRFGYDRLVEALNQRIALLLEKKAPITTSGASTAKGAGVEGSKKSLR